MRGWVQKRHDQQEAALSGRNSSLSPEIELKQLRKENERLQRERDILKKAVAIFSPTIGYQTPERFEQAFLKMAV